jgi:hypothetical protein
MLMVQIVIELEPCERTAGLCRKMWECARARAQVSYFHPATMNS